jgi:hypothetical protein
MLKGLVYLAATILFVIIPGLQMLAVALRVIPTV